MYNKCGITFRNWFYGLCQGGPMTETLMGQQVNAILTSNKMTEEEIVI